MNCLSGRDVEWTTGRAAIAADRCGDHSQLARRKERWIEGEASRRVPGHVTDPSRQPFAHDVEVHVVEVLILHDQTYGTLCSLGRIGESTAVTPNSGERE